METSPGTGSAACRIAICNFNSAGARGIAFGNRGITNNFYNRGYAGGLGGYGGYGGYGRGYGGYGRGYGGYGGTAAMAGMAAMADTGGYGGWGLGWGYPFLGGLGWGLGMGLGMGLGGWGYGGWGLGGYGGYGGYGMGYGGYGPMLYDWGYSQYSNPYYTPSTVVVVQQPAYDYAQPLNPAAAPPAQTATDQANTLFDQARETFKGGNYASALTLVDQALQQLPNDPSLHEFRALILFSMGRFEEAATPLYAVLAVGPGWDWPTLIGLYPDVDTYTRQFRALETYVSQSPQSAAARFVLAYHYLTQGHADAAVTQLREASRLQPKDTVSAQLLRQLQPMPQGAAAGRLGSTAGRVHLPYLRRSQRLNPSTAGGSGRKGGNPRRHMDRLTGSGHPDHPDLPRSAATSPGRCRTRGRRTSSRATGPTEAAFSPWPRAARLLASLPWLGV